MEADVEPVADAVTVAAELEPVVEPTVVVSEPEDELFAQYSSSGVMKPAYSEKEPIVHSDGASSFIWATND